MDGEAENQVKFFSFLTSAVLATVSATLLYVLLTPLYVFEGPVTGYVSLTSYHVNYFGEPTRIDLFESIPRLSGFVLLGVVFGAAGAVSGILRYRSTKTPALLYGASAALLSVSLGAIGLQNLVKRGIEHFIRVESIEHTTAGVLTFPQEAITETTAALVLKTPFLLVLATLSILASTYTVVLTMWNGSLLQHVSIRQFLRGCRTVAVAGLLTVSCLVLPFYAGVFMYSPAVLGALPTPPPLKFSAAPGLATTLGPNGTYAHVTIYPSIIEDLLSNWDFNESLTGWSYSASPRLSWGWQSSTSGSSGGVAVVTVGGTGTANISQKITLSVSASVVFSFRIATSYGGPPGQFRATVTMSVGGCSRTISLQGSSSWSTYTQTCPLTPGIYTAQITFSVTRWRDPTAYIYLDYFRAYTASGESRFSGDVLQVRNYDSKPYYVRLVLQEEYSLLGQASMNIAVCAGGYCSTPIIVTDGTVVYDTTSLLGILPGDSVSVMMDYQAPTGTRTLTALHLEVNTGSFTSAVAFLPAEIEAISSTTP